MPGFVIHLATAQEYLRKHNRKYSKDFLYGSIEPDFTDDKSKTHYGKSPAYTNLYNFLMKNDIENDFYQGYFLHLIEDYLFYNKYLEKFEKPQIYDDYDITNRKIIDKYKVEIPEKIKDKIFFKEGTPKLLTLELAYKIIDEISDMDLEIIKKEVMNNETKWKKYKNIV